jgi:MiaB-like tRNA modifying enzyme
MRVFVQSFGCSSNVADGEVLAGCLAAADYTLVNSVSAADLVVYNTCAVKGPTENRMVEILKRVPKGKKVIVAGCLPLINFERLRKEVRFNGVTGPAAGDGIVNVVEGVLKGKKVFALEEAASAKPSFSLPRLQVSPVISVIPVSYGCLGSCAYCCVVFARGHLRSYGIEEVVERVKNAVRLGSRELWITSQDTACYGKDQGTNLAVLLDAVCSVKGDFKVRVGMMTPNMAMEIVDELIDAFRNEKVFKFLHLPVQSGDNDVLRRMRRLYSAESFRQIVDAFRASFPDITVSTDVICGFPGESERAFEKTRRLIAEVRPDIVNVSKFFARPGTAAAEMQKDFVPLSEIKRRSSVIAKLVKEVALERNQRWVSHTGEILVDEVGKVSGSWIGRNFAYKPVVVKSAENLLGKTLRVRIVKAFSTHLEGVAIE